MKSSLGCSLVSGSPVADTAIAILGDVSLTEALGVSVACVRTWSIAPCRELQSDFAAVATKSREDLDFKNEVFF